VVLGFEVDASAAYVAVCYSPQTLLTLWGNIDHGARAARVAGSGASFLWLAPRLPVLLYWLDQERLDQERLD